MINLIPNHEKKKKVKDFYFRLLVVFLAMFSLCATAGIVSLLPTYFLSHVEKNLAQTELAAQKNEPATALDQDLSAVVTDLNKKFTIVEQAEKNRYFVSEKVVREVILRKMPDIKLHHIFFERDASTGPLVKVSGTAPSRERLLLFRQRLEDGSAWKTVDLPISNFVKGADILFNLTLVPS